MTKALFLDRDGVINVDTRYLVDPAKCVFIDGIFDVVKTAQARGYKVIIVTNQSGIARGYYTEADFHAFMEWLQARFIEQGCAPFDGVYYCTHHPECGEKVQCNCRKPAPGQLLQAQQEHDIDMAQSLMVGDKASDMGAAKNAGLPTRLFLPGDYGSTCADATAIVPTLADVLPYLVASLDSAA